MCLLFLFFLSSLITCLRLSRNHPVSWMLNEKAYLLWSWPTLGTLVPRWIRSSFVCCPSPIPSLGFPLHQVYDKSCCPPVGVMETREAPWGLRCHHCKNKPVCRLSISHLSNNLRVLFQLPPNQFISLRAELWLKVEYMDAFLPLSPRCGEESVEIRSTQ